MLKVITWYWQGESWRQCYTPAHVNALQRMVKANLKIPHEFICITDKPEGMECRTVDFFSQHKVTIPIPNYPNSYRRIRAFSEEAKQVIGEQFVSLDLDAVITGDITPLFDRHEAFVILQGEACHYNGSLWMHTAGTRTKLWTEFNPDSSPFIAMNGVNANGTRFYGSDQAWISYTLGDGEATWPVGPESGVYQYSKLTQTDIPNDARIVFFAGETKPWTLNPLPSLRHIYNQYLYSGTPPWRLP